MANEVAQYISNFYDALDALETAKMRLKELLSKNRTDPVKTADVAAKLVDLEEQIALLKAAYQSFKDEHTNPLNPPSQALIAESTRLAKDAASEIAAADTATAIFNAATKLVSGWATLNSPSPVAAAAFLNRAANAFAPLAAVANVGSALSSSDWLKLHTEAMPSGGKKKKS